MKALTSLSEFYLGGGLTDELLLDPKLSPEMAMEYLTAVKRHWAVECEHVLHVHPASP